MDNKKKLFTSLSILFFFIVFTQFLYSLRGILSSTPIDFLHYYLSSEAVLSSKNPYIFVPTHKLSTGDRIIFNYPPTALLIFLPLAIFPVEVSRIIWELLILFCLILSIKMSFSLLNLKPSFFLWLFVVSLTLLSFPVRHTFGMGQVSLIILFFLLSSFYFLKKGREVQASFFLALSMALKIFPLIILLYLLLKKRWKFFLFSLLFLSILVFLSIALVGIKGWEDFLKVLPKPYLSLDTANYYEQSLISFVKRLEIANIYKYFLITILELFILLSVAIKFLKNKSKNFSSLEISLLLIVAVIATSFNWQHYYSLLIFPFLTLFVEITKKKTLSLTPLFIISYFLVSFNIKNPTLFLQKFGLFGSIFLSHHLYGALILFFTLFSIKKNEK